MSGMVDGTSKFWLVRIKGAALDIHGYASAEDCARFLARNAVYIEDGEFAIDYDEQARRMRSIASAIARDAVEIERDVAHARGEFPELPEDLFDPARMPARDEHSGEASHPDLYRREWYEGDPADRDYAPILHERLKLAGWDVRSVEIPNELLEDAEGNTLQGDDYAQAIRFWQPEPPPGEGWILVSVSDSEDGPGAMFVRRRLYRIRSGAGFYVGEIGDVRMTSDEREARLFNLHEARAAAGLIRDSGLAAEIEDAPQ
jgi:hypothetical protein